MIPDQVQFGIKYQVEGGTDQQVVWVQYMILYVLQIMVHDYTVYVLQDVVHDYSCAVGNGA